MLALVHSSSASAERTRAEARALLALSTLPGWGYWTIKGAAAAGLSLHDLLRAPSDGEVRAQLRDAGVKHRLPTLDVRWPDLAERAWNSAAQLGQRLHAAGVQLVLRGELRYPRTLEQLDDPPEWLFVRGAVEVLARPSIALVGTREPSDVGLHLAWYLGEAIALFGVPTVSGLALGIDQLVHRASLVAAIPTVAVLGTGMFLEYPAGSMALANEIVSRGGAVVTEYLPEQSYAKENFVRRNRIQAALARVVIPVEWTLQSGTSHTVRYAEKLGRALVAAYPRTTDLSRHPELLDLKDRGGRLFQIPGEEDSLVAHVRHVLTSEPPEPIRTDSPVQLKLL